MERRLGRFDNLDDAQAVVAIGARALTFLDALQEVLLLQEQTDLQTELESFDQQIDMSALERDFVANAAPYSASKGISYGTWRRVGVSADLLREAGIPR